MSLVNKSADWTPNSHKILIFSPTKSLKSLRAARIDELADSNEPAITIKDTLTNLHFYQDLSDLFEGFRIEPTAYPDHPISLQTSSGHS